MDVRDTAIRRNRDERGDRGAIDNDGTGSLLHVRATAGTGRGITNHGTLSGRDLDVVGNAGATDGGGILDARRELDLRDSRVSGNVSVARGGGIFADADSSDLSLRGVVLQDNRPDDCHGC